MMPCRTASEQIDHDIMTRAALGIAFLALQGWEGGDPNEILARIDKLAGGNYRLSMTAKLMIAACAPKPERVSP